jgi:hypothetical protein
MTWLHHHWCMTCAIARRGGGGGGHTSFWFLKVRVIIFYWVSDLNMWYWLWHDFILIGCSLLMCNLSGVFLLLFLFVILIFLCCPIMCIYALSSVSVTISAMLGSSLPPVVSRKVHALFTLCVFICKYWCPTHIVLCFWFVFLRLVCPILTVSLDCPFLIAPSVFFNVYISPQLRRASYIL